MFASSLATTLSNSLSYHLTQRIFLRVRAVLMQLIYRKTLRLASKYRSDGTVNNLMTSDTQKILELGQNFQGLWTSPIIIAVAIYELYEQVQWSAFLGLATLVIFFPVAAVLTGSQIKYQALCAGETDKRLVLVNEFVLGIRVLKYLAWERSFLRVMDAQREKEIVYLRSFVYIMSLTFAALLLVPLLMSVIVFASYAGRGQDMTPAVVFTTISLINVVRWPFTMLPMALGALGQALVALGRIERFLQTPEIEEERRLPLERVGCELSDAQFTWPKHKEEEKKGQEKGAAGEEGVDTLPAAASTTVVAVVEGTAPSIPPPADDSAVDVAAAVDGAAPASHAPASGASIDEQKKDDDTPAVPCLTAVNLAVHAGELLMVLGPVGSGKFVTDTLTFASTSCSPPSSAVANPRPAVCRVVCLQVHAAVRRAGRGRSDRRHHQRWWEGGVRGADGLHHQRLSPRQHSVRQRLGLATL